MVRTGSFVVDYENLNRLRESKGLSWNQLAQKAGIAVGNFNHWKSGKGARAENLRSVASALDLRNLKTLVLNTPPIAPDHQHDMSVSIYIDLFFKAFLSKDFEAWARSQGGFEDADVVWFVKLNYAEELYYLSISQKQMDDVHQYLCRQGWLEEVYATKSPAQGRSIFIHRAWGRSQCDDSLVLRIANEQLCAARATRLASSPESFQRDEHRMIVSNQTQTIREINLERRALEKSGEISHAYKLIDLDYQFHMNWAGRCPSHIGCLRFALEQHKQAISRFAAANHRRETYGIPHENDSLTLQNLAAGFSDDTDEIFQAFLDASDADETRLGTLEAMIARHATESYSHVPEIERLADLASHLH